MISNRFLYLLSFVFLPILLLGENEPESFELTFSNIALEEGLSNYHIIIPFTFIFYIPFTFIFYIKFYFEVKLDTFELNIDKNQDKVVLILLFLLISFLRHISSRE